MSNLITNIFTPQTKFEGSNNINKLINFFTNLYRIDLFKDGLDLILTKLQQQELSFEVKIIKDWDTNVGCFLTTQRGFFDRAVGKFFHKKELKIILRQLSYNVLAHEMAHAVDFESGASISDEFRKCIAFDMQNNQPHIITLKAEAKRLMIDAVKSYPAQQILAELFARYFELLAISRDVCGNGDFKVEDVKNYFINTSKFITEIFNPNIKKLIDQNIANQTSEIARNIKNDKPQQNFSEKIDSFHKKIDDSGQKSWSKNTRSNSMYQQSWQNFKQISDNKEE